MKIISFIKNFKTVNYKTTIAIQRSSPFKSIALRIYGVITLLKTPIWNCIYLYFITMLLHSYAATCVAKNQ